jgi:hypothetical protein
MRRKPGLLAKFENARVNAMIESLGGRPLPQDTLEEILDPGRKQIARFTDEELAELMARGVPTKEAQLAASEMRRRESWRTPARWALLISVASALIAAAALVRTF